MQLDPGRDRRAPAPRPGARRCRRSGSRRRSARGPASSSGAKDSPFSLPPRIAWTPPSKARRPTLAEATLVALESLTKRTPSISATRSSRCGDAGEAAQALAHRFAVEPHRERRRGGGHRVVDVVLAEEAELGDREQRLAVVEDRSLGDGDLAVGRGAVAEGDAAPAAAEVDAGQLGVVGVVDGDVVVALVGEDPQLRRQVGLEVAVAIEVVRREVEEDRALGREGSWCPRAGSSRPRRPPSRPARSPRPARRAACRRCRPPRPARRRRGRCARAARPWSSCRWSRSRRRSDSAAPARQAPAPRPPRSPAPERPRSPAPPGEHPGS